MFKSVEHFIEVHEANEYDYFSLDKRVNRHRRIIGKIVFDGRLIVVQDIVSGWGKAAVFYEVYEDGSAVCITPDVILHTLLD